MLLKRSFRRYPALNDKQSIKFHMDEKSRTEHSAQNTTVAMIARVVAILIGFCTRVVFTHTLSEAYVGVNGLFTDILNVLSLSELGIETAITYALYKPIAEADYEKQKSLMGLFRYYYRIVAAIVLLSGFLVIPFFDVLIKGREGVEGLLSIYLLYLANSALSYLLIFRKTLIDAHQMNYIPVLYHTVFLVIQNVLQMMALILTRHFFLFLFIQMACTVLNNVMISHKAVKMFPYLKDKNIQPLPDREKKEIFQNIRAMMMHKVGNVVVSNTDNLLLSSLIGVVAAGVYANYFLIIGSVRQVLNQVFQGITASVGNLGVEESEERIHRIFGAAFFINQWIFGFATICLYECLNPFVHLSFGEQYVFAPEIVLVLCLNFYLTGMRQSTLAFRDSLGLFWYDRYKSVAEALINLVVSLFLGYHYGVIGIFLGTLISTISTSLWVEPWVLYKYRLKKPVWEYFFRYAVYMGIMGLVWCLVDFLCKGVQGGLFMQTLIRLVISAGVTNIIFLAVYWKSDEFVFLRLKLKNLPQLRKFGK